MAELNDHVPCASAAKAPACGHRALTTLRDATEAVLRMHADSPAQAQAVAVPYLTLADGVCRGVAGTRGGVPSGPQANAGCVHLPSCRLPVLRRAGAPEAMGLARVVKGGAASVAETASEPSTESVAICISGGAASAPQRCRAARRPRR